MKILLTGGSGFLGRGIMREWPQHEYVVYSRDEYKQYLCKMKFPDATYVLGDVKDYDRLVSALRHNEIDTIIHTAALKFIPEAEINVDECVEVNIEGTRNVLAAAVYSTDVVSVIGVSTDKAVLPVNTYGMTKAIMERLFTEQARLDHDVHYGLVRYGNVVGSTGSVIPEFERRLKEHGQLEITDPDMSRYWLSIQQAVELIGLALAAESGSIIIPKPRAMKLLELAETVCNEQSTLKIVGPRPGEKRHEQLLHQQESVRVRDHMQYYELCMNGVYSEPFILSSNTPEAGWFERDQMRQLIAESRLV